MCLCHSRKDGSRYILARDLYSVLALPYLPTKNHYISTSVFTAGHRPPSMRCEKRRIHCGVQGLLRMLGKKVFFLVSRKSKEIDKKNAKQVGNKTAV